MSDDLLLAILHICLIAGIVMTMIASMAVVIRSFSRRRPIDPAVLSRLEQLEAAVRHDAGKIDRQFQARLRLGANDAKRFMADLTTIAADLQKNTIEMHDILDDLQKEAADKSDETKKINDLEVKVGKTESQIDAILRKIGEESAFLQRAEASAVGEKD